MINESNIEKILKKVKASNMMLETLNQNDQRVAFSVDKGTYSLIILENNGKYDGSIFTESDTTKKIGLNINAQFEKLTEEGLSNYIKERIYGKKIK